MGTSFDPLCTRCRTEIYTHTHRSIRLRPTIFLFSHFVSLFRFFIGRRPSSKSNFRIICAPMNKHKDFCFLPHFFHLEKERVSFALIFFYLRAVRTPIGVFVGNEKLATMTKVISYIWLSKEPDETPMRTEIQELTRKEKQSKL